MDLVDKFLSRKAKWLNCQPHSHKTVAQLSLKSEEEGGGLFSFHSNVNVKLILNVLENLLRRKWKMAIDVFHLFYTIKNKNT